ncbi:MAG: S46 family peptidase [Bacteroidales bacterium]|nr:S46 family peptidase [Bacteroidales bacterium]
MFKNLLLSLLLVISTINISLADEGMWLLSLLNKNYDEMKAKGFRLSAEDIYSVNQACLKDAIVGLGNERNPHRFFCTGEIISDKGLFLTNHHCGYGYIQSHSSEEHDYLKNGFWAMNTSEELPNEGMVVSILVRMEDVTEKVLDGITDDMNNSDRNSTIRKNAEKIQKEAETGSHYGASVKAMFEGNQYFLFVYETFKDIRLVGTPPESIGKFGGDTDNWMWPRHTGDFSMFRIYAGKDNKPASFSSENVPYKPKFHLPISLKGIKKGDFAMVMGFPGSTERYLTSYGIKEALELTNPAVVKIRTEKLRLMKEDMMKSDKIRIQYSSKHARTANYWKYYIGQSKGLKKLNVQAKKEELEKKFDFWVNSDKSRKAKYGNALNDIEQFYNDNKEFVFAQKYFSECIFQGGEVISFALRANRIFKLLEDKKDEDAKKEGAKLIEGLEDLFKDFNLETDKKIFQALMKLYKEDVPQTYQLDFFNHVNSKYKGSLENFTNDLYAKSVFIDINKYKNFLENPSFKTLKADPAYLLVQSILKLYGSMQGTNAANFSTARRLYLAGLLEMMPEKHFYPDANSTIRLTYGTVGDYQPADAIHYDFFTTIEGIMEKEDPSNYEFIVPEKLKSLYKSKDFGRYGKENDLWVCFTTNNDITGGNSGSPVINGNGELIGTAFDGNWEAMSGDIAFENNLQKCINVDIRYVLFIIDKLAGAKHLVDEMTIIE